MRLEISEIFSRFTWTFSEVSEFEIESLNEIYIYLREFTRLF